jgi:hypothetical protein
MTLDLWWKDDIRNVLVGIDLACAQMAADRSEDERRAYREGFRAALSAVAASLGAYPAETIRFRQEAPHLSAGSLPALPGG